MKFYVTYRTSGNPYSGGWSELYAEDRKQAIAIFRAIYPDKNPNILNCATIYTAKEFEETDDYKNNNRFGAGCHETIMVNVKKY